MAKTERFKLQDVEDAIRMANGIVSRAKSILESKYGPCGYNTVKGYLQRHPHLQAVKDEVEEQLLDAVEAKAYSLIIKDSDSSMIRYYLSTKGKHRGWTQRLETTGPEGGPIQHQAFDEIQDAVFSMSDEERAILREMVEKRKAGEEEKKAEVRNNRNPSRA